MGKRKSPEKTSDRETKWDKVFNALVKLSQNLHKDRDFLEHRVKYLQDLIYRMKMEQKFETVKAELKLGLKEREAFIHKHRYGKADDELSDMREWLVCVSQNNSEPKSTSDDVSNKGKNSKALQDEVRKLRSDMEQYEREKNAEIASLLAEKKFVWNQYNQMESDFTEKLKKKCDEVDQASENVQLLVNRAEELQFSNEKLRSELAKMESESARKSEEISRLLREIEHLKSRVGFGTPFPPLWDAEDTPCKGAKNGAANDRVITVKKESGPVNTLEKAVRTKQTARKSTGGKAPKKQLAIKGSSSFKRKPINVITIPDTPKLFSSSFKVPKLKRSFSPQAI